VAISNHLIENCYSSADVSTPNTTHCTAGGLVGSIYVIPNVSYTCSIVDSYFTGNVAGLVNVGGLVGFIETVCYGSANPTMKVVIDNCYTNCNVTSSWWWGGGLVGAIYAEATLPDNIVISDSFAAGNVFGPSQNGAFIGSVYLGTIVASNNYYNQDATLQNASLLYALPTTLAALANTNHAVYQGSGSNPTPWIFAGDTPVWAMGTLPELVFPF
jgi:hypothetical protein